MNRMAKTTEHKDGKSMPEPLTTTITIAMLKKPIEELYKAAEGSVKRRLKAAQTSQALRGIYKAMSSILKVKTMWSMEKEVKLTAFYYPSKVSIEGKIRAIDCVQEIEQTKSYVIQGTVGQGKSIFLRYLCIQEIARTKRVPIFVELRRYDGKKEFRQFLTREFERYGLPSDDETFEFLATSGRLVLLLDAFDEIELTLVTSVISEIENLVQKYPDLQTVITSRPESGIEKSPHFRIYSLAPLLPNDHKPFLHKIVPEDAQVERIVDAISKSPMEIRTLLGTPLLLTLLVIVYNATQEVPPTMSAFYEELFRTLLIRHDSSKPGFHRKRASRLSDSDLKRLFEAFCYAARQQELLVFNHTVLERLLDSGSALTGVRCSADGFVKDITQVACLMQREGFQYQFIHKSVAEFHAASFISRSSNDTALKFYQKVATQHKWLKWRQELEFLSQIDRYRFCKNFYIPSARKGIALFGIDALSPGSNPTVSTDHAKAFLMGPIAGAMPIDPAAPPNRSAVPFRVTWGQSANYATHETTGFIVRETIMLLQQRIPLDHRIFSSPTVEMPLGFLIEETNLLPEVAVMMTMAVRSLIEKVQLISSELQREEQAREFIDP